jgi:stringent starvation protein B
MEYARDGQIVLNIAPRAVGNLELANDEVRFNARFGGVPRQVSCRWLLCWPSTPVKTVRVRCLNLKRLMMKMCQVNDDDETAQPESETVMSVIDGDKPDHADDNDPDDDPPPRGGRPSLRVVK